MANKTLDEALAGLDPKNDEHWTSDGAPRLDHLSGIVGEKVKRDQVLAAAPTLTREAAAEAAEPEAAEPEAAEPEAPTVMDLPFERVMNSIPLLEKVCEEIRVKSSDLSRQKDAIAEELAALNKKLAIADRQRQRLLRAVPGSGTKVTRDYLEAKRKHDVAARERQDRITNTIAENLSLSPDEVRSAVGGSTRRDPAGAKA